MKAFSYERARTPAEAAALAARAPASSRFIAGGTNLLEGRGVKHWHGAALGTAMTHLAVTGTVDGRNVEWMEKVSDDQYTAR